MAEALKRKSTFAIKAETTYGQDPTIASTDVIEIVDFNVTDAFDVIERNISRNTLDPFPPVRGAENLSGDITVELKGSGTAGTAPPTDVLWQSAIGPQNQSTASTTTTGSTQGSGTTDIVLSTGGGANFAVGDAILIDPAGGTDYEVAWITAINGDTITVSPQLSAAPGSGVAVGAGIHYKLSTAELISYWIQFWRGDIVLEKYAGNRTESVEVNFETGQIVQPVFRFQGKQQLAPVTQSYTLGTPPTEIDYPHIARYMKVIVGGTSYPVEAISFAIGENLIKRQDVTTSGVNKIIRTQRTVTGSFNIAYEDATIETDFRNDTEKELVIVSSQGASTLTPGNTFAIRIPNIKYTEVPKTEADGIYKYNVTFTGAMTTGEDSITSVSFL